MLPSFSRYLPSSDRIEKYGWRLIDAGRQIVEPGSEYPNINHPKNYLFDKKVRRVLDEYQVVFILKGKGYFEAKHQRKKQLSAGQAVLLFPGEWHSYQPHPSEGWKEYWVGLTGSEDKRIVDLYFSFKKPIFNILEGDLLMRHFEELFHRIQNPIPAQEEILASYIPIILAWRDPARNRSKQSLIRITKS